MDTFIKILDQFYYLSPFLLLLPWSPKSQDYKNMKKLNWPALCTSAERSDLSRSPRCIRPTCCSARCCWSSARRSSAPRPPWPSPGWPSECRCDWSRPAAGPPGHCWGSDWRLPDPARTSDLQMTPSLTDYGQNRSKANLIWGLLTYNRLKENSLIAMLWRMRIGDWIGAQFSY